MIENLSKKKCFNHARREAAARCLECRNFFCPECITEHSGRLTCSSCLHKASQKDENKSGFRAVYILQGVMTIIAFMFICIFFFLFARILYNSPETFHYMDLDKERQRVERVFDE